MAMSKHRQLAMVAIVLCGAALVPANLTAQPSETSSMSPTSYAAAAEWRRHSNHPDYPSCAAAAATQGRNWQCRMTESGTYDLYLWY
jgi:hypothetical protein